jgi:hypothetical protein
VNLVREKKKKFYPQIQGVTEVLREYNLTLAEGGITNEDEAVLVEWVRVGDLFSNAMN